MSKQHHGTVCKTCRKRGKKCDKLLPACSTCIGKGITCEGYTFRWSGVASRGKLAGKKIPVADAKAIADGSPKATASTASTANPALPIRQSSAPVPKITWPTDQTDHTEPKSEVKDVVALPERVGFTSWEHHPLTPIDRRAVHVELPVLEDPDILDLNFNTLRGTGELGLIASANAPAANVPMFWSLNRPLDAYNVPPEISYVLDYFLSEVCPRLCVDMSSHSNPYSQYILPLAIQTPSLLYACAALAACQVNIRLGDKEHHMKALRFKGKSMKRLQECLYSNERAKDPGTVATILMLSLCDLSLGGSAGFDAHFLGAKRLIDMRGSQKSPGNFVEQYIAWLDTMAAASSFRKPIFSATEIADWTSAPDSSEVKGWSYDVFPCPVDHFLIINEIVELYKSQKDPKHPSAEVLEKVQVCKERVLGLPMRLERDEYWLHLTEAYRFSIVIYLMRLFNIGDDVNEIAWLTGSVFRHANSTEPLTGWADQMLWPLFHAALEVRDDARKQWTRDRSQEMLLSGGFRNVETAMEILERVWASGKPTNYMEVFSGDGSGSLLFV